MTIPDASLLALDLPPNRVFEVASSRIRENSEIFRGGRPPNQSPNSHEFGYSPSKCATSKDRGGDELRLAAAIKLCEVGRLSLGAAAELAGVPKPLFMLRLSDYGVDAFRMTKNDFAQETPVA